MMGDFRSWVESWLVEDVIDLEEKAGLRGWMELLRLLSTVVGVGISGVGSAVVEMVGWASFLK